MNDMSNAPISESRPESVLQTWTKALTKPNEQTFADIAASPNARASTAYLWVFIGSLIQVFLTALVQSRMLGTYIDQAGLGDVLGNQAQGFGSILISAICGAPIAAAVTTLFFAIGVFIVQWIARMFGGTGTTDRLAYTMASIVAPFSIVAGVLSLFGAIPYVGLCFSVILSLAGIYIFVLEAMAVKAVNRIGWGAAIGSLLIPGLVIGLLCACLVGVSFAALLPLIRDAAPNFQP
jgi:Yip1-like protein